jgi:hypothetical protein
MTCACTPNFSKDVPNRKSTKTPAPVTQGILLTHSFIDPDRSAGHLTPVVVAEKLLKALPKDDLQY